MSILYQWSPFRYFSCNVTCCHIFSWCFSMWYLLNLLNSVPIVHDSLFCSCEILQKINSTPTFIIWYVGCPDLRAYNFLCLLTNLNENSLSFLLFNISPIYILFNNIVFRPLNKDHWTSKVYCSPSKMVNVGDYHSILRCYDSVLYIFYSNIFK